MFTQSFDNDIIHSGNGSVTAAFFLDASPSHFGAPAGVLVEAPLSDLNDEVAALREVKLRLWKIQETF